jgi:DNA-dependent RNA polymerase auxiliary subunit epsilon
VTDTREEQKRNTCDSMHVNAEFVSNKSDECDLQYEKQNEERI